MKTRTVHVIATRDQSAAEKDAEFVRKLENGILHAAGLSGVFYRGPWEETGNAVPMIHTAYRPDAEKDATSSTLVPPDQLRHWYSIGNDDEYLRYGRGVASKFRKVFTNRFGEFGPGDQIIEIGCSAGRVIRWFEEDADRGATVWGADIDASAIMWAQENLSSKLRFFTNTTAPNLPFRDGTFNLIFGSSLFTHIGELADIWFLELARLLNKERGMAIISMNDDETFRYLKQQFPDPEAMPYNNPKAALKLIDRLNAQGERLGKLVFNSSPWQQSVWYSQDFVVPRLKRLFNVDVIPQLNGYQTGYVLTPL